MSAIANHALTVEAITENTLEIVVDGFLDDWFWSRRKEAERLPRAV